MKVKARLFAWILLIATAMAPAKVQITVDHNDLNHSTAEFSFKRVPAPSKNNAAMAAKFSVVAGSGDENCGGLDVLHDGKLPGGQDDPAGNFFFNPDTDGGRIVIDLGAATEIKQINTYSWHTDTRAPQVYTLYAVDASTDHFNPAPGKDVDPTNCGWKRIADVDTRPKSGDVGGQYGVNISDSNGTIGTYRYLLLETRRTESNDSWGNTFYSEISVTDAHELLGAVEKSQDNAAVKTVQIAGGKYTATIDTRETPDLTDWANNELAPVVADWYPQLVHMLPGPGYTAPDHFSITFRKDKKGVADTGGTRVNCAAAWFRANLATEAKGAIVHEMVHVVQQYGSFRQNHPHADKNPGWLVEGIADYVRWYAYEPQSDGTAISKHAFAKAHYDDSYRTTANFLNFVAEKYDKHLVAELNSAMRNGTYTEDQWKTLTGKSVEQLNLEWKNQLANGLGITTKPVEE